MLLRMLVANLVRQTAEKKLYDVVAEAARHRAQSADSEDASDESQEPMPCDVAVTFALGIESGGLVDSMSACRTVKCPHFLEHTGNIGQQQIVIAESGVGPTAAAQATDDLIVIHRPQWVVAAGFAAALTADVRKGHFIMPNVVVDESGEELSVGLQLDDAENRSLHTGRLLTVDRVVRLPQEKNELRQQFQAVACDMETAAIAKVCRTHNTGFIAVRIVTDVIDDALPTEIKNLVSQESLAGKLGAAAGALWKRPSSVKDMWRLKEEAFRASEHLAKFLQGVLPQLTKR